MFLEKNRREKVAGYNDNFGEQLGLSSGVREVGLKTRMSATDLQLSTGSSPRTVDHLLEHKNRIPGKKKFLNVLKGQQTKILISLLVSNDGETGFWVRTTTPELERDYCCRTVQVDQMSKISSISHQQCVFGPFRVTNSASHAILSSPSRSSRRCQ